MKKKIAYILVCLLFFSTIVGSTSSAKESTKILNEMNSSMEYLHTVLVEVATAQNCQKCAPWSQSIYDAYTSGDYDFEYVEMIVFDHDGNKLNDEANNWAKNYSVGGYPNSIFDGDYQRIVGNYPSQLPDALNTCGNRAIADITAGMTVLWLGDATIQVEITIENNEETQYNGHIRVCITEIISRYTNNDGDPYHFGFLDYAFNNKEITISAGGLYTDSTIWNGNEHQDNHGDDFGDIDPDNIQVTMGILNDDDGYVDETITARVGENNPPNEPSNPSPSVGKKDVDINADLSWSCSDPDGGLLEYDVYFGSINPPSQVTWNQSGKSYDPGAMNYNLTYYWKIVAWDNQDASTSGQIWSFTTQIKKNKAPEVKITMPERGIYIRNKKILQHFPLFALIIGDITIEVNATDEDSSIEKVDFYINGKLKRTVTTKPYTYLWTRDRLRLFHIFVIKVEASDTEGETDFDWMIVRKLL